MSNKTSVAKSDKQTVVIKHQEKITIFDLTLTNLVGGHDIMEDGSDPSSVDLLMETPRKGPLKRAGNFANESNHPDADIAFDNYVIRINSVSFDADEISVTITKLP